MVAVGIICFIAGAVAATVGLVAFGVHLANQNEGKGNKMKRKYAVVDYLQKHYPPPEGSGEVEVEFLEGYDSIEGPDGSMGFGVFVPTEEKIYIADDLPGGEESMIETVAHEWKHWLQYCNDEAYDEEEAEDFARQIVEEFL